MFSGLESKPIVDLGQDTAYENTAELVCNYRICNTANVLRYEFPEFLT